MGFREPLDLSEIIPQYRPFLRSTVDIHKIDSAKPRAPDPFAVEPVPEDVLAQQARVAAEPRKVGTGPLLASTETALALSPEVCHDVLGYYRLLGVHWRASRRELRLAYHGVGGEQSADLTYILKQLLNDDVRRSYDRTPLGELFLDDARVQDYLKAKASREAARRTKQGQYTTVVDVIKEEYDYVEDEPSEEQLEAPASLRMSRSSSPETNNLSWDWAYYSWKTNSDTRLLARWQAFLISACATRGEKRRIAVGLVGGSKESWLLATIDGSPVLFLADSVEPTPSQADAAICSFLRETST